MLDPVVAQLKQGTSPAKIALTLAAGVAGGLFPFLGFTTLLCLLIAAVFRLNQPVIHLVNQLMWPLQLTMIVFYIRLGEWIYGATPMPFNPREVTDLFFKSQAEFWARFGLTSLHAFTAWLISVPILISAIYFPLRPVIQRFSRRRLSPQPLSIS